MLLRCIDFEATGLPSETERHYIVEVGATDIFAEEDDPVWRVQNAWSAFAKPDIPIPPQAMGVHHITDAMVEDAPDVCQHFMRLTHGGPDYYVAHNAEMEQNWFGNKEANWLCTYKIALRFWPEAPDHKLGTLQYYLDLQVDRELALPAHRAGPDAYVCAALMKRIMEDPRDVELETLAKWSKGPALLPRCPIGKFRNRPWVEVDNGFLQWVLTKSKEPDSGFGRDLIANVKHHLKHRGLI